jgi:hypothetical protein
MLAASHTVFESEVSVGLDPIYCGGMDTGAHECQRASESEVFGPNYRFLAVHEV